MGLAPSCTRLSDTIAVVLGVVGVKLLIEDVVVVGPVASLAIIFVLFGIGIGISLIADARDPQAEEKRREREQSIPHVEGDAPAE